MSKFTKNLDPAKVGGFGLIPRYFSPPIISPVMIKHVIIFPSKVCRQIFGGYFKNIV